MAEEGGYDPPSPVLETSSFPIELTPLYLTINNFYLLIKKIAETTRFELAQRRETIFWVSHSPTFLYKNYSKMVERKGFEPLGTFR